MIPSYRYKARYLSAYDADTIRVDVDLGFGVWLHNQPLRLLGVDAPEIRGAEREAGLASRDALRKYLEAAQELVIETDRDKSGKYGRWLARVWVKLIFDRVEEKPGAGTGSTDTTMDTIEQWMNINAWLVDGGWAKPYGKEAAKWVEEKTGEA